MLETEQTRAIFADAWTLYDDADDAIEQLNQGKIRNAAAKAWGATDALLPSPQRAQTGMDESDFTRDAAVKS